MLSRCYLGVFLGYGGQSLFFPVLSRFIQVLSRCYPGVIQVFSGAVYVVHVDNRVKICIDRWWGQGSSQSIKGATYMSGEVV